MEPNYHYTEESFKEGVLDLYIASLFFIVTTYSTVGYGTFTPTTDNEKIFVMFLSVFGVIQYGYTMQKVEQWVETFQTQDVIDQGEVNYAIVFQNF
jgi:Ion channel.